MVCGMLVNAITCINADLSIASYEQIFDEQATPFFQQNDLMYLNIAIINKISQ